MTLYLALRRASLPDVGASLAQADFRLVLLALLSVAANVLAKSARWKVLLGAPGERLRFSGVLMALLAGQVINAYYPARAGDLARAVFAGEMGPGKAFALGTIVLEKVFDSLCYLLLLVLLLLLSPIPGWMQASIAPLVTVSVVVILLALVFTRWREGLAGLLARLWSWQGWRLPAGWRSRLERVARSALSSLEVLAGRRALTWLVFWSLVVWGTALLNNFLVIRALDLDLVEPRDLFLASLLVLVALQAGISLPAVPGRIGVFEYICVLSLAVFGVSHSNALGYGILLHAVVLLPPTLFGLLSLAVLGVGRRSVAAVGDIGRLELPGK